VGSRDKNVALKGSTRARMVAICIGELKPGVEVVATIERGFAKHDICFDPQTHHLPIEPESRWRNYGRRVHNTL
jgi:hypothetical protein